MKSNAIRVALAAGALTFALGFSACGSSDNESDESSEATTTTTAPANNGSDESSEPATTTTAPANAQIVKVSMVEMAFTVDPPGAKAGNVTFELTNDGTVTHEMAVIKTNTKAGDLPTDSSGKASEEGALGEGEAEPGETDELSLKLASGHYALICNLPGHYAAGMYADFNVK